MKDYIKEKIGYAKVKAGFVVATSLGLSGFLFKGLYKEEKPLLILAGISATVCIVFFMKLNKQISIDIEKLKVEE